MLSGLVHINSSDAWLIPYYQFCGTIHIGRILLRSAHSAFVAVLLIFNRHLAPSPEIIVHNFPLFISPFVLLSMPFIGFVARFFSWVISFRLLLLFVSLTKVQLLVSNLFQIRFEQFGLAVSTLLFIHLFENLIFIALEKD